MEIKQQNLDLLRNAIQSNGLSTKAALSRLTGLSLATCNNLLNELLQKGELTQTEKQISQGGRPAQQFVYNKDYLHILSVFLEHDAIALMFSNALGEQISYESHHCDVVEFETLLQYLQQALKDDPLVSIISIGIPGAVNGGRSETYELPALKGLDLQNMLIDRLHIPVIVDNDMAFTTYGAYWAKKSTAQSFAAIAFPNTSCVGSGMVIEGKLYSGHKRFAGELAHALAESTVPLEMQNPTCLDKESFLKLVARSLLMTICVLSPEYIVIMGDALSQDDVSAVYDYCSKFIDPQFIPPIELSKEFRYFWGVGMVRMALNKLRSLE